MTILIASAAMIFIPAIVEAGPVLDWLCGNSPNMTAQSTYVSPYYAPAYEGSTCATSVCATSSGCSSCTQQVVQYTPYTTYQPISVARSVTAYYPATAYNGFVTPTTTYCPGSSCYSCAKPVTAYYAPVPVVWTRPAQVIPYTTYRMSYMPVTYLGYAMPTTSCYQPCATGCAASLGCSSCGGIASYEGSSCSSCQSAVSTSFTSPVESTPTPAIPATSSPSTSEPTVPKTFQDQKPMIENQKPVNQKNNNTNTESQGYGSTSEPDMKPIPRVDKPINSTPEPQLIDPEDRSTSMPKSSTLRLATRQTETIESAPSPSATIWREASE